MKNFLEKTGGKIVYRVGGVVYLFRGRNYEHSKRPQLPVMLWKPATPVYPKLIQDAPEGLTKEEADDLRVKGKSLLPICKLSKNGVYISLVNDVRNAFEGSILVKIDCRGMQPSDYKKLGAKLKDLVPCVLLSFDDEQILMWRGRDWISMYHDEPSRHYVSSTSIASDAKLEIISLKMMSLLHEAVESGKASVLENIHVDPDELLSLVEDFERKTQAKEHSYTAVIYSNSAAEVKDDAEQYTVGSLDPVSDSAAFGSLPIDMIANELSEVEVDD